MLLSSSVTSGCGIMFVACMMQPGFKEKDFYVMKRTICLIMMAVLTVFLEGCAPEVGSEKWCANLKAKPKGDWSFNEATDYAKHCILK